MYQNVLSCGINQKKFARLFLFFKPWERALPLEPLRNNHRTIAQYLQALCNKPWRKRQHP